MPTVSSTRGAGAPLRGTFIIDKQGVVRYTVVNAIPDARDPDEYEKVLASLADAEARLGGFPGV